MTERQTQAIRTAIFSYLLTNCFIIAGVISIGIERLVEFINHTKANLLEEDPDSVRKYPPYIINRCMSGHIDAILFANEMNKHPNLDKDMQYSFYLNTLRKRKRFSPWLKKNKSKT